ncbi:hypothetical protein [Alicyclobacillus kakegawensis]|uniref:hypothetical protein n=1 Tax=Alicyclobacillus kakegawensis TaxID=392012 RepID=UPI0012ED0CA7|nr:hypothetical protein [Alicyclobacillus kakegawensis]
MAKKRNGPRVMDRPRAMGLGAIDGGYSKTEARHEFLRAVDRVEPRVRQELLELVPLVGKVEGFPSETVGLLENKDFALTVPRTPQDVQEVDVELVDGRVVRTTVVTRSAWRETWDALLDELDAWSKRWWRPAGGNAAKELPVMPQWMNETALCTVVYAAAGWSQSWRLPPFEVQHAPVAITVETPELDLTVVPASVEVVMDRLQPWLRNVAKQLIAEAKRKASEAGLQKAPRWRERDTDLATRMDWVALRLIMGFTWLQVDDWTRARHPDVMVQIITEDGRVNWTVRDHVNMLTRLLKE